MQGVLTICLQSALLSTQKQLLPELGLGEKFGQVWSETWCLEGLRKSRAR